MPLKLVPQILIAGFCALLSLSSRADTVITNFTRDAVQAALTNGGTITFATNAVTNATIFVTNTLSVVTNASIDGGSVRVVFSGSDTARVFHVANNVSLTLANLMVIDGRYTNGAGIFVSPGAEVNITNCTLSGNHAFGPDGRNGNNASSNGNDGGNGSPGTNAIGGAIYNLGVVNIANSLITSNTASGGDGGKGGDGGPDSAFGGEGGNGGKGGLAWGGGIYNEGTVFIINSTLTNNLASAGFGGTAGNGGTAPFPGYPGRGGTGAAALGGGIYNRGLLVLTNSTVVTNLAFGGDTGHGGVEEDGNNGGIGFGGGIFNAGTALIGNSTFTENAAAGGKGGDAFSGNFIEAGDGGSARGGAIYSSNQLTIVSCTLATNNATGGPRGVSPMAGQSGSAGGSLGGNIYRGGGQLSLRNTILAKGFSGANFAGTSTAGIDGGRNICSDASCNFTTAFGSRNNQNARLLPLADNGGLTATMALGTNSPAKDAGDCDPDTDQRGISRPQGPGCDIGAFELVPTFSISGTIFEGTNGVSNIVVTAGGRTGTSTANGSYTIAGLVASNYVVTPTPVGAGFTPASTNVIVGTNAVNPSGNVSGINFSANSPTVSPPSISTVSNSPSGSVVIMSLQFTAMPKRTYRVQYSTNLSSTNWIDVSTNLSSTNGFFEFNQTNLSDPQRFFRTVIR